jgi:Protein of unknown function (DUF2971)
VFDFVPLKLIPKEQDSAIQLAVWNFIKASHRNLQLPETLYHYTDAVGLKGIIESGVIRATHISFMNDASEYLHAVSLLREAIAEIRATENDPLRTSLLNEINDPVALTRPQDVGPYFVACFSAKENSLNQWRAYGRGEGGFSIGFDPMKLDQRILKLNGMLSPVNYDLSEQSNLVRELLRWGLSEYQRVAPSVPVDQRDKHRRDWAHMFLWRAAAAAPIIKNPAFAEEGEWRLIHLPLFKEDIRFIPRQTGLSPFTELRLGEPQTGSTERLARLGRELPDRLPIKKMWSGPGRATDTSLLAGRTLLEQMNYDGVSLEASKIPYRVG